MNRALLCSLLVASTIAYADSPKLDEARKAVESVAYDEAAVLLKQALEEGGNSQAALTEIYRLAASTAIVLGDPENARIYYRSWVALDPKAALPTDTAAKFQDPFVAAQAYVKTNGPLKIKIGKTDGSKVAVLIESDPLKLAASASLDATPGTQFAGKPRIVMPVPSGKALVRVTVFDKFGNQLVARSFTTFSDIPPEVVVTTPLIRKWPVWAALGLVAGGAGYYFRREADQRQDEIDAIVGTQGEHFFGELEELRDRRDRSARIATGLFIGAGALAATAVVMWVVRPRAKRVMTPTVEGGAPGIAVIGTF